MTLLLIVAAAIAVWAWRSGKMRDLRFGDVAAVVAALCGIRMLGHGESAIGVIAIAGAGGWGWLRSKASVTEPAEATTLDDARSLLEVPPGADQAAVEAAHRRLIGRVHPDAGGSNELARRVNGARDMLIADLNRRTPRAS